MLRDGGIDGLLDYSHPLFCEPNCLCFLTVGSLRQRQDRRKIGMIQRRDPIARGNVHFAMRWRHNAARVA